MCRNNLNHAVTMLAVFLVIFIFALTAAAQETAAGANSNQTAVTTPVPAPTAIPLSDIVSQTETAAKRLQEIQTGTPESPGVQVIERELPELTREIDARLTETTRLLSARPSLDTLRRTDQEWQALAERIPAWKRNLRTQIGVLDTQIEELKNLGEIWQKTLESLENPRSAAQSDPTIPANTNVAADVSATAQTQNPSQVPPEVLQRIREIVEGTRQSQRQIEERRARLLTFQTRVSEQETRLNETLASIREVREVALSQLFIKDSPAIWNVQQRDGSAETLFEETEHSFISQIIALNEYAGRQRDRFVLHGIIFLFFIGALFWVRRRVRPLVEKEPELERAVTIFKLPIATALVLAILFSGWLYPQAPRLLTSIIGAAALAPVVLLLQRLLEKPLFPVLNALVIFYFFDQLRAVTESLPLVSRILFIAEVLGAIVFLVWFLRSKRLANKVEVGHFHIFSLIKKAIPFSLILFAAALIANIFGYVSLSNVIGNGVLGSAYIALVLYTAVQIFESLLIFAFRVRPLVSLRMVKEHRFLIRSKVFKFLKWFAIAVWLILTLNLLSVRETIFTYIWNIFTAELALGSLSISLGDLIVFLFTIWLAFMLSRFLRFVLEEDVYPRVELAGGVSYAISTMLHYALLVIGFFMAIAALGVDLSRFAILAGALGVGLGFGLQNIVNNFVSGLILLFERPVKVGDTVQLGEHQGDLHRIGLRASVVRKVDGSDVIVPNSQLISEEVINWTLSDQRRRLDINVGVAYGNDPEFIIELLSKVAIGHENVLKSPPPRTIFVGFGDNSLDFQLRAWTNHSDTWVVIKSELTIGVNKALTDAAVEIPFPQRDMNLKVINPKAADIFNKGESAQNESNSGEEK